MWTYNKSHQVFSPLTHSALLLFQDDKYDCVLLLSKSFKARLLQKLNQKVHH